MLKNSRVPADLVADCLQNGELTHEIAYNYDLNLEAVARLKQYLDTHQPALRH